MKKYLYLTLKKKWFDEILRGNKKIEYRDKKPYWTKRLFNKENKPIEYDFIFFRNGYSKDCRKMEVEFKGIKVSNKYEILLGNIVWSGK